MQSTYASQQPAMRGGGVPTYLPAITSSSLLRGAWSHERVIVSGYSLTGPLMDIDMDGVTKTCNAVAGRLDIPDIITWWQARASYTGYGGTMPRVSKIYNQSSDQPLAHWVQTTNNKRPVLDLNQVTADGLCPISFNNYNARSTLSDGTALSGTTTEDILYMTITSANLSFNSTTHSLIAVLESASNVGVSSTTSYALIGMNTGTAANRTTYASGNSSFSTNMGLGALWDTTTKFPTDPKTLATPLKRFIFGAHQAAGAVTIDGQVGPTMSLQLNGGTAQVFPRTGATSGTGTTFYLGADAAGTFANGAAFGFHALVLVGNGTIAVTGADQRPEFYNALQNIFGVSTTETKHVALIGSSSVTAYASSAGGGISAQVQRLLGNDYRCATYAKAGTSNATLLTSIASISAVKRAGVTNTAVILNARNDLSTGGRTGAAIWADVASMVDTLKADGWNRVIVCTLWPSITGGATLQATYNVERGAYNTLVMSGVEQALHGHVGVDLCSLSYFNAPPADASATAAQFGNRLYVDDDIHTRGYTASADIAALIAAAVLA